MTDHALQLAILSRLLRCEGDASFSALRPTGIENDQFNYHLRRLVSAGLVRRGVEGYRLTSHGKQFVEEIVPLDPLGAKGNLFRINVLLIVSRTDRSGTWILNQRRARQPFYGDVGIPGGLVRRGEPVATAAARKLREETGLEGVFRFAGTIRKMRRNEDGYLLQDIVFHVCRASDPGGLLLDRTPFGEQFWIRAADAAANERNSVQGSAKVAQVIDFISREEVEECFYVEEDSTIASF